MASSALMIQVVGIVGAVIFLVVETARGETRDVVRAVMFIVTVALLGLFVAVVARALRRGRSGARMPAIVWDVMLLPVGFDLVRGGQPVWGLAVLALALTVIVGCALAYRAGDRA